MLVYTVRSPDILLITGLGVITEGSYSEISYYPWLTAQSFNYIQRTFDTHIKGLVSLLPIIGVIRGCRPTQGRTDQFAVGKEKDRIDTRTNKCIKKCHHMNLLFSLCDSNSAETWERHLNRRQTYYEHSRKCLSNNITSTYIVVLK